MNNVEVRAAAIFDSEGISRISSEELGYPCNTDLVCAKLTRLDPDREAVFVAVIDNIVAGFVHVERYDTLYFDTMANILGLAVSADHQRRGVGRALITAAEKWAAENRIKIMRLNSGSSRTPAHEFYQHLGYVSEKEQKRFTKKL